MLKNIKNLIDKKRKPKPKNRPIMELKNVKYNFIKRTTIYE